MTELYIDYSTELHYTFCGGIWAKQPVYEDPVDLFWDMLAYELSEELDRPWREKILWLINNRIQFVVEVDTMIHTINLSTGLAYFELTGFHIKIVDVDHIMLYKLSWL